MANRIVTATVTGESIKLSEKSAGASGSFNAVSLAFTFDSKWDGTSKKVYFFDTYGNNAVYRLLTTDLLVGGAYVVPIPAEPLVHAGEMTITVKGVDFATDGTTAERIIMSASTTMNVLSAIAPASDVAPQEPTPTQAEQLLASVNSVTGMTVTSETLPSGSSAVVTKETNPDGTINIDFGLPTGATGAAGRSVVSVIKTGTVGLIDTYTITFSDSTTVTFSVSNGYTPVKGTDYFDGATGNGISSIVLTSGNHAAGTTDTYTITFTSGATTTFTVYNGADGIGAGDMLASVYDPTAKNADAFSMANMVEETTNKIFTATERTKLTGISTGATANSADATLLARANHTGTQLKSTISDFPTEMTPSSHAHGNITNDGKIGSTADLPIFAGASGTLVAKTIADAKTLLGIVAGAQVSAGSYTGTGTFGVSNISSYTFSDAPKLVFIKGATDGYVGIFVMGALSSASFLTVGYHALTSSLVSGGAKKSADGKILYWFSNNASQHLNTSGEAFIVVSIT